MGYSFFVKLNNIRSSLNLLAKTFFLFYHEIHGDMAKW